MTFYVEKEVDVTFAFDENVLFDKVCNQVMSMEKCPYSVEVNLLFTDDEGIRVYNKEYRNIDKETDVLSFPAVDYLKPSDFSLVEEDPNAYLNPDTNELMLGDIILNVNRIFSQAEAYGHSVEREYAFLVTHSLLHLLGYDHMTPDEEEDMFQRQNNILDAMGIVR